MSNIAIAEWSILFILKFLLGKESFGHILVDLVVFWILLWLIICIIAYVFICNTSITLLL
jgi:hypothetical protein